MPVNLPVPVAGALHPVPGVRLGIAEAGIRKADRKDLTVVLIEPGASVAGVFTQNRFCAAPVQVCREHLARGDIRAMVINTGNANAGTGEDGLGAGPRHLRRPGAPASDRGAAGAAVLDRRDHGAAAASSASRPACPRRSRTPGPTTGCGPRKPS